MLALKRSGDLVVTGNADTEADLVGGSVVHPLLVEDILTADVRGNVTTNGVTHVGSTVGVELSSLVTSHETNGGEVTDSHQLDVEGSLDEVSTSNGAVRNDTGVVTGLGAVGDGDLLNIGEGLASTRGSESAPVIDRVDGCETRNRGLVDGSVELGSRRVGGAVLLGGLDTRVVGVGGAVGEGRDVGGRRVRLSLDGGSGENGGAERSDGLGEEHADGYATRTGGTVLLVVVERKDGVAGQRLLEVEKRGTETKMGRRGCREQRGVG